MSHSYERITNENERKAPKGKYRVILNDRSETNSKGLYLVADYDSLEDAIRRAEELNKRPQNGIVQDSAGWVLYPSYDGHHIYTREELLATYGRKRKEEDKSLTAAHIDAIEAKQSDRIPGWKPGDRLIVFWADIAEATGARARPGDF